MTEKKKREKVVAEITLSHVIQLARENDRPLSEEEALDFLNQDGHAYDLWKHMMHAGEEYLKSSLRRRSGQPTPIRFSASGRRLAV
ncbi:MAG TPA: hypothetical protein VMT28_11630 [Terriglobales bacterium]|jgi:hypothetical protein|nr:hypothetical protein [Terriglobales bacterium]